MSGSGYDCIVVGAGMAGLTYATLAAQNGARVLVLEQHYLPGGSFTAFKNGKYLFNVALEWTTDCAPGETFDVLLKELRVRDDYPLEKISTFKTVLTPLLAQPLHLPCGREALQRSLAAAFPHQTQAIARFLEDCIAIACDPMRGKTVLMKSGVKPVEKTLADYFDDPLLIHCLFSVIAYPGARGVLLMYIIAAICMDQMFRPVHGDHRRLASLLHARLRRLGAEVHYGATVAALDVSHDAVRGVALDDGTRFTAPHVVVGVDPWQLYERLLADRYSDTACAQALLKRKSGLSTFCVYLGLNTLPASLRHGEGAFAVLAPTETWQDGGAASSDAESLARIPLRVECQSLQQPRLAPTGGATLAAWAAMPISAFDYWGQGEDRRVCDLDVQAYLDAKRRATEVVVARLKQAFPGLAAHIELIDASTPFTVKRYTMSHEGSVSGYSLADLGYLKPGRYDTPVAGLHHIGQWVVQSGVNNAMYSASQLYKSIATHSLLPGNTDGLLARDQRQKHA